MAANYERPDHLEGMILSWSYSDLKKEEQVEKIHTTYSTSEKYVRSFRGPIIEEIRSDIKCSLQSVSHSEYYRLLNISKVHGDHHVYLDVDTCFEEGGHHLTHNDDIFLISDQEPKDLQLNDNCGVFVIATNVTCNGHFIKSFQAKISGDVSYEKYRYAIFLCNLKEVLNMWRTLDLKIGDRPLTKIISTMPLSLDDKSICASCDKKSKPPDFLINHDLHEEQLELALRIVSNAKCDHRESIEIIWGLPGIDESKTIATCITALQGLQTKTLICGATYSKCSTLCCSLDELIRSSNRKYGLGRKVGDVVILCDLLELQNDTDRQFCLEWRLNEIMPCMLWKIKIDGLISLLEKDFRDKYKKVTGEEKLSALDLLKCAFKYKSTALSKMLKKIWMHSPSHDFSQGLAKGLAALLDSLERFNNLLASEDVTDDDVKVTFALVLPKSSRATYSSVKSANRHRQLKSSGVKEIERCKHECLEQLKFLKRNLNFPHKKDIHWMRKYLIEKSAVIISTPSDAHCLQYMANDKINMLIVTGAEQIKECELLAALSLPSIQHVSLIGDDAQLCPTVKSMMNEKSGFGRSLFEKLILLGFNKHLLKEQRRMHPSICHFPNEYFYGGKISNAFNETILKLAFQNYLFFNVNNGKALDAIIYLITAAYTGWKEGGKELVVEVGVVCSMAELKIPGLQSQFHLTVQSTGTFDDKNYHILIIQANEVPVSDRYINYMITRARHYLWIVGDETKLAENVVWKKLIEDAKGRGCFQEAPGYSGNSAITEKYCYLSTKNDTSSTHRLNSSHVKRPVYEINWVGRPHHQKFITPPVRDQGGENHCAIHSSLATMEFDINYSSAELSTLEDFNANLSDKKVLQDYNRRHKGIGKEIDGKGSKRLLNVFGILQTEGAISDSNNKVYKISGYKRIYDQRDDDHRESSIEAASQQPRKGIALIVTVPISKNFQDYKAGDVYQYEPTLRVLNPLSNQPSSHAMMVIGGTEGKGDILLKDGHMVVQNSHGETFGNKGIGRIKNSSAKSLYEITM